jgi:hypothetical protein
LRSGSPDFRIFVATSGVVMNIGMLHGDSGRWRAEPLDGRRIRRIMASPQRTISGRPGLARDTLADLDVDPMTSIEWGVERDGD